VDNSSPPLDVFIVEDCSDDEDLEEEQLDFTFFKEEYERSPPSSLAPVTLEIPTSPKSASFNPSNNVKAGKSPSSPSVSGRWRDMFSSNRSIFSCPKLMHFSTLNDIQSYPLLTEDLDHSCDD
jgi:hypothetical protein